jgi:anti-anti-sigma factor
MQMTLIERSDRVTHVVLAGRLDTLGAEAISEAFAEATVARGQSAVVDLSDVAFLASRGIGLLVVNGKQLMKAGHRMVLINPTGLVQSVLKTSRLDVVLPIARDLAEAMEILQIAGDELREATGRSVTSDRATAAPPTAAAVSRPLREGRISRSIRNQLAELEDLNAALSGFLEEHGVPYRASYAVKLAIDELVVNVMRYAYVDDETHWIDIDLAVESQQVVLRIVDDGRPFDPRGGPRLDQHAEDREVGGLGLILVLDMVDVLDYRRAEDRNHVEVRIRLGAVDEMSQPNKGDSHDVE